MVSIPCIHLVVKSGKGDVLQVLCLEKFREIKNVQKVSLEFVYGALSAKTSAAASTDNLSQIRLVTHC
jgi:hypothetical protein